MIDVTTIKQIPIVEYLQYIGHQYVIRNNHLYCCASIVRPGADNPRNFVVTIDKGLWHDVVSNKGGSIIDLVMIHRNLSYTDTITWLSEWHGQLGRSGVTAQTQNSLPSNCPIIVDNVEPLHRQMWLDYLRDRGLFGSWLGNYLFELSYHIGDSGKRYGLGWKTNSNGWCIRNKMQTRNKLSTSPADITLISGNEKLIITEGMFDYLSLIMIYGKLPQSAIILNSTAHVGKALNLLSNFKQIHLYLDNDDAGNVATETIKKHCINAVDHRTSYINHNDVNEYLKSKNHV